jgi:hypothetical protein
MRPDRAGQSHCSPLCKWKETPVCVQLAPVRPLGSESDPSPAIVRERRSTSAGSARAHFVIWIGVLTPHAAMGPQEEFPAIAPGRLGHPRSFAFPWRQLQEALLGAWRGVGRVEERRSLVTRFYAIATNSCLRAATRAKRRNRLSGPSRRRSASRAAGPEGVSAVAIRLRVFSRWCRAGQRSGVDVSDLIEALGEFPAVRGALVAVVVNGVVQVRVAVAPVH